MATGHIATKQSHGFPGWPTTFHEGKIILIFTYYIDDSKDLFSLDRALQTHQEKTPPKFGELVSLLKLITGLWVTQKTAAPNSPPNLA